MKKKVLLSLLLCLFLYPSDLFSEEDGTIGNDLLKNNSTGFSAQPGGIPNTSFNYIGESSFWWSSTKLNKSCGGYWHLDNFGNGMFFLDNANNIIGFSVRCVRDN